LPAAPGGRVAESLPPPPLRIGRPGDPQEPIDQLPVVDLERHERPVIDGGEQLITDGRSADVIRNRWRIGTDLEPRALEYLLEFHRPLPVVDEAIGPVRTALADALEVGGDAEVRLCLPESFFQQR